MTIESIRAARRAAMPTVTALLAEFAEFAPTVVYASENGITAGKKPDYSNAFTIPANYFPCAEIVTKGRK
jgi:hypothetical protein